MSLKVKGKILKILNPESGVSRAGKEWNKQEFVIETEEQFSKNICFTLFNDKVSLLNGFNNGDEVEVSFNLESREFNGRWYHNVNAWKIDINGDQGNIQSPTPPEYQTEDIPPEGEDEGDLPF